MLCQNCGKNPVTTQLQQNINGKIQKFSLCSECAAKLGAGSPSLGDLFSTLFADSYTPNISAGRCSGCGLSFSEIKTAGKVGCGECYNTFYEQLLPSLDRIHGKSRHVGKVPGSASQEIKKVRRLALLREKLSEAVASEAFEDAARLRDEIKELESGKDGQNE